MIPYTEPQLNRDAFNCPHCNAYANQKWYDVAGVLGTSVGAAGYVHIRPPHMRVSRCEHCGNLAIWVDGKMTYPEKTIAPLPNPDMPENIKRDFEEARLISGDSPKGAAALLRLCVQKLCIHLGEGGENINKDIANLVEKGLPQKLQRALDSVRVVGNNAVHPGHIDLNDDPELTYKLFHFINLIVETMISNPKEIDEVYNLKLPEGARAAIDRRDNRTS